MTNPGQHGDQGGEHGGAMDKLKSVWREAIGARDDEVRGDGNPAARPAPSGTAHPADARPDLSARNASGMQPADERTGPATRQLPQQAPQQPAQQGGPGSVPRQQQPMPAQAPARQEQPVAAGYGPPSRGATQAPPAPAPDDRSQQQVPPQAAPPARPTQPAVPQQSAPQQSAPQQAAPPAGGAPAGAAQQEAPSQQSGWAEPERPARAADGDATRTTDQREAVTKPEGNAAAAATDERATDRPAADTPAAGRTPDGTPDDTPTDKPRGRHELTDAERTSSGAAGGAAAGGGAATAAGMASAASRTDKDAANNGSPAGTTATGGRDTVAAADVQDVPADPEKFVPAERAEGFAARWSELKGDFVDEPRDAVHKADALVGDVLEEIAKVFTEQRSRIEHDLDTDGTSTEDLRQAMHRYRRFFERLLNI